MTGTCTCLNIIMYMYLSVIRLASSAKVLSACCCPPTAVCLLSLVRAYTAPGPSAGSWHPLSGQLPLLWQGNIHVCIHIVSPTFWTCTAAFAVAGKHTCIHPYCQSHILDMYSCLCCGRETYMYTSILAVPHSGHVQLPLLWQGNIHLYCQCDCTDLHVHSATCNLSSYILILFCLYRERLMCFNHTTVSKVQYFRPSLSVRVGLKS